jgi:hypothetical protein
MKVTTEVHARTLRSVGLTLFTSEVYQLISTLGYKNTYAFHTIDYTPGEIRICYLLYPIILETRNGCYVIYDSCWPPAC